MNLKQLVLSLCAGALLAGNAQGQIRVRFGEEVSHQTYRFRNYFPDHDWGFYRDRTWYGGQGTHVYFQNGNFAFSYREAYNRRASSPWGRQQQPQLLSKELGKARLEELFENVGVHYIQNIGLNLGNGVVKKVDFMVQLRDWVPVKYVDDVQLLPFFQRDKVVYDAMHSAHYILIPPTTREQVAEHLFSGLQQNGY